MNERKIEELKKEMCSENGVIMVSGGCSSGKTSLVNHCLLDILGNDKAFYFAPDLTEVGCFCELLNYSCKLGKNHTSLEDACDYINTYVNILSNKMCINMLYNYIDDVFCISEYKYLIVDNINMLSHGDGLDGIKTLLLNMSRRYSLTIVALQSTFGKDICIKRLAKDK